MRSKTLCAASLGVTLASFAVSELKELEERKKMKAEIKKEVLDELTAENEEES